MRFSCHPRNAGASLASEQHHSASERFLKKLKCLILLMILWPIASCMINPINAYTETQPKTAPVRNLTDMDLALECLDRLLIEYRAQPVYITSTGLPNRAGEKVGLNSGVDMLVTSIGQLKRSNAFHYVDLASLAQTQFGGNTGETGFRPLEPDALERWLRFLREHAPSAEFQYPGYIIKGSISQLDNNTMSDQQGAGLGNEQIGNLGLDQDQIVSVVTVDMQVLDSLSLGIKNGLTTKNSLAVVKKGIGVDLSGRIKAAGAFFNVSYDRSEGLHQGIRDLIQLGTIELLGRLAKVPYQQCLVPEPVAPGALQSAQHEFDDWSGEERIRFVQESLAEINDPHDPDQNAPYYTGAITGTIDAITRDAIARYRRESGLIANAEIDLDLYRSLKNARVSRRPQFLPPIRFVNINGQALGYTAIFPIGSQLRFGIALDGFAHTQCFLKNQDNLIYRIFPTIEQPDDSLKPGRAEIIPRPDSKTAINLDSPTHEEIGCISSLDSLAAETQMPLSPLGKYPLPGVSSLQEVYEQCQKVSQEAIRLDVLRFEVQ